MTEKEAIEKLHNEKKIDLITLIRKFKKEGIENFVVTRQEIIETVLKVLEQKNKEISELKEKYDKDTHTLQNQLDLANADRVKKDKIIDVIVQEYEYNAGINVKNFCEEEMRKDKCIQDCRCCIKQYFAKKVRNKYV